MVVKKNTQHLLPEHMDLCILHLVVECMCAC